jgi:DNA-binding response OmpR family regulator
LRKAVFANRRGIFTKDSAMACILLVDDDSQLRAALRKMLEEAGHEVIDAKDGVDAIRYNQRRAVDLVLTDLFMPRKDGLEIIRELHRDFPHLRILAMSGGGFDREMDLLEMAERLGAIKTLKKPFDKPTLLAAVEAVLRHAIEATAE